MSTRYRSPAGSSSCGRASRILRRPASRWRKRRPPRCWCRFSSTPASSWVLLTKRADSLSSHRGQIAFPAAGSKRARTPGPPRCAKARRRSGIDPKKVLKLGQLDAERTPSGFHIVPCVGVVPFPLDTVLNKDEIEEVFPVPILALANPQMIEDRTVDLDGMRRVLRVYHVGRRQIWGFTARVLENLLVAGSASRRRSRKIEAELP